MSTASADVRQYHWAGLDFMIDEAGTPVFLEANRSSHMLAEYLEYHGDERPFALVADVMNRAPGPPCLLWRSGDPFPDADEDACFIGRYLARHLRQPPVLCNVEDNQEPHDELKSRDGTYVRPGSVFRWWYGLPWSYERSGATVINPNCVWTVVRDKLTCAQTLAGARSFRVPRCFPVSTASDVARLLAEQANLFATGFVLKPRVGWGGYGVQVGSPGDTPRAIGADDLLSERILPQRRDERFWVVRVFVMAGVYLGGIQYRSRSPVTNYWQGGLANQLDPHIAEQLRTPALEAVHLLDAAADHIHNLPTPPATELTRVIY